jgi:ubiquinone biosynthesis accessory factor UbiK
MPKSPFSMFKPEMITDLAGQASKLLPGEKTRDEIQRSLQLVMQNALAKLDIVSREEFDAQTAVLQKTRAKVDLLETELAVLMARLEEQQK